MLKRLILLSVILLAPLTVNAQGGIADFKLTNPTDRYAYQPGDIIEINWKAENFEPSNRKGITVNLVERNSWKRVRIAYITKPEVDGSYSVHWKIPNDFFERKKIDVDTAYFKIEIKSHSDGKWIRELSRTSLVQINKSKPIIINNTVKTTVTAVDDETSEGEDDYPRLIPQNAQLTARYEFNSLLEPWIVKRLTVVNDTQGDGFDLDPAENTDVISKVYVRYPNPEGQIEEKSVDFTDGKATLSNLNFYIPKRESDFIEIWVDTIDPKDFGQEFSGNTYRIGILDTGNNADTFEAIGQITNNVDNALNLSTTGSDIHEFVVREGVINFEVISLTEQDLYNGDNNLFEFKISGDSVSLGRLVFDITQSGLTTLDQVQILRNGSLLTPGDTGNTGKVYLMWDAGGTSCFAHTPQSGAGTGMDCVGSPVSSAKLIITFTQEEIIWGDATYKLRFNTGGVDYRDRVSICLNHNDDDAKPVIAGSSTINGKIHNGGGGLELFGSATGFVNEASTITDRNIIWSDKSADFHQYPNFTPSINPITDNSSSADWTNGYLLKLNSLPTVTSIR